MGVNSYEAAIVVLASGATGTANSASSSAAALWGGAGGHGGGSSGDFTPPPTPPTLRPAFTVASSDIYGLDDVPATLRRSDGRGTGHIVERHLPFSPPAPPGRLNTRFDSVLEMHAARSAWFRHPEVLPRLRALVSDVDSGARPQESRVTADIDHEGRRYRFSVLYRERRFHDVTGHPS